MHRSAITLSPLIDDVLAPKLAKSQNKRTKMDHKGSTAKPPGEPNQALQCSNILDDLGPVGCQEGPLWTGCVSEHPLDSL